MTFVNAKKKVLIVNQFCQLYGAEVSLLETVGVLAGFHPIVMTAGDGDLKMALEKTGVSAFSYDFRAKSSGNGHAFTADVGRIIDEHDIHIVHFNKPHLTRNYSSGFVEAMYQTAEARNIPTIVHVRSTETALDQAQMRLLTRADKIICVSHKIHEALLQQKHAGDLKSKQDDIEVIYNGRTLGDYAFCREKRRRIRRRLGLKDHDFVLGLVGRFDPVKGQDRLVQLAKRFQQSEDVKFLLVGDVMQGRCAAYKEHVVNLIKEHQLHSSVLLTGYIDGKEIMSGLDVLLSLSDTEGLPGVVIEAMAAERCLVANAVGGTQELIGNEDVGYCVEKNDLPAMEYAIRRLQHDPVLAVAMGQKAVSRSKKLFDISRHAKAMTKLYRSLI